MNSPPKFYEIGSEKFDDCLIVVVKANVETPVTFGNDTFVIEDVCVTYRYRDGFVALFHNNIPYFARPLELTPYHLQSPVMMIGDPGSYHFTGRWSVYVTSELNSLVTVYLTGQRYRKVKRDRRGFE